MDAPTTIHEESSVGSSQFTDPDGKKTDEKGDDDEAADAEKDLMVWKETVAVKRAKVTSCSVPVDLDTRLESMPHLQLHSS